MTCVRNAAASFTGQGRTVLSAGCSTSAIMARPAKIAVAATAKETGEGQLATNVAWCAKTGCPTTLAQPACARISGLAPSVIPVHSQKCVGTTLSHPRRAILACALVSRVGKEASAMCVAWFASMESPQRTAKDVRAQAAGGGYSAISASLVARSAHQILCVAHANALVAG